MNKTTQGFGVDKVPCTG